MSMTYTVTRDPQTDERTATVLIDGKTYVADQSHPAFDQIMVALAADDPAAVLGLFDIGSSIANFASLSERVIFRNGKLYFDDDEMDGGIVTHIIRMIHHGEDPQVWVQVWENILLNPSANSREQLFRFIRRHGITITRDGRLVLYKFVNHFPQEVKPYRSTQQGEYVVNGIPGNGYVHQDVGDVVTMPRSHVADRPEVACSTGLHVGAWAYVGQWGGRWGFDRRILAIYVDPRDVVSVPADVNETKVRVCRYEVVAEVSEPYEVPVLLEDEPEPTPVPIVKETPSRIPSLTEWESMRVRAKRRRQNFVKYASTTGGWMRLLFADGSERDHWRVGQR